MVNIDRKYFEDFAKAAHKVGKYNLAKCSSGNLSCRVAGDTLLLSRSGAWLSELTVEDIVVCRISDCAVWNGKKPTMENVFHRGIMDKRPDVNVVLHFQSPNATTIACTNYPRPNFNVIAEIPVYIGDVAQVPYIVPGSAKLAEAVIEAGKNHDMIMMKNHGLVTVGKDYDDAIQKAVFFELACEIILKANRGIRYLSDDDLKDIDEYIKGK